LRPGHDPSFPERSNFASPPAELGVCLKEINTAAKKGEEKNGKRGRE